MKREVVIILSVNPEEYNQAVDTPQGAIDLVFDMLKGDADFPEEEMQLICEHTKVKMRID